MESDESLGKKMKGLLDGMGGFSAQGGEVDYGRLVDKKQAVMSSGGFDEQAPAPAAASLPEIRLPKQEINLSISLDGQELTRAVARASDEMNRQFNTRLIR